MGLVRMLAWRGSHRSAHLYSFALGEPGGGFLQGARAAGGRRGTRAAWSDADAHGLRARRCGARPAAEGAAGATNAAGGHSRAASGFAGQRRPRPRYSTSSCARCCARSCARCGSFEWPAFEQESRPSCRVCMMQCIVGPADLSGVHAFLVCKVNACALQCCKLPCLLTAPSIKM